MQIELNETDAESLLECIESAYSEGQGGDVTRIIIEILNYYPTLKEAFGHLLD